MQVALAATVSCPRQPALDAKSDHSQTTALATIPGALRAAEDLNSLRFAAAVAHTKVLVSAPRATAEAVKNHGIMQLTG